MRNISIITVSIPFVVLSACGGEDDQIVFEGWDTVSSDTTPVVPNQSEVPECTKDSNCKAGFHCVAGKCVECPECEVECETGDDCDDGDTCKSFICDEGKCGFNYRSGAECDDGNANTIHDTCSSSGKCVGVAAECQTAGDCDDQKQCTTDACVGGECENTIRTGACDDGNPDTIGDACVNAECVGDLVVCTAANAAVKCDDDNPCTTDECIAGDCEHSAVNGGECDDGNANTIDDTCVNGVCIGGTAECTKDSDCDDGNDCTDDVCDIDKCFYPATVGPCDDGNKYTVNDKCIGGKCVGEEADCYYASECDDDNICTTDSCVNGACQFTNKTGACDDGNSHI